jgi:hypothetical protein
MDSVHCRTSHLTALAIMIAATVPYVHVQGARICCQDCWMNGTSSVVCKVNVSMQAVSFWSEDFLGYCVSHVIIDGRARLTIFYIVSHQTLKPLSLPDGFVCMVLYVGADRHKSVNQSIVLDRLVCSSNCL